MILATRSFVCPKTGRVCNVYSMYCRERCLQVAGQVDVIRAGKGAGEGRGGNLEATASCPPSRWEEGGVCAAAGCQEPREPAPLGGARLSLRGARSRRGARSSLARAASAASTWRGRRAAGRGAMGECAARGAPRGLAAGRKRVSAGRPGIAHLPPAVCGLFSGGQAAGTGWHSEVGAGGGPRSRGGCRAWA